MAFGGVLGAQFMQKFFPVTAIIAAFVSMAATSASAADLPAKAPAYSAPVAPVAYNWTGFYAGLHAGGVWGGSKATDLDDWNGAGDTFTAHTSGFMGGAQIGYNWQAPNSAFVWGVEADLGYLGFNGQKASALSSDTFVDANGGWYGTVRGRLGVAPGSGRWLMFVTGGVMFADVNATVQDNSLVPGGGILATHPSTGMQTGWTAGGGVEYALANGWSLKGEYLYFDLGTKTVSDTALAGGTFRFDIDNTGHIVRLGLNYRFWR